MRHSVSTLCAVSLAHSTLGSLDTIPVRIVFYQRIVTPPVLDEGELLDTVAFPWAAVAFP